MSTIHTARGCKGSRFGGKREQSVVDRGLRSDGETSRVKTWVASYELDAHHLGKERPLAHPIAENT